MNRENFDMDGSLITDEPNPKKRNKKKGNNRIMIFLFVVLVILCIIAGYYYIVSAKEDLSSQTSSEATSNPTKESIVETIADPTIPTTNSNSTSNTTISQTNVNSVVVDPDTSTLALDISKVKSDKAQQGAVQFRSHIVGKNEDLNSIAALYGLKVQTLISINEIKNISGIQEGVELTIPDRNGSYYIVKSGDMLSSIASTYSPNLGWKTLQEINGLTDTRLDIGDKIFIPDMSEVNANPAISTSINQFIMPTASGSIVAKYGQFMENNPYNDEISLNGVLIKTKSSIVASSKGVVVDIQNKSGKKQVKLSHEGGYETVYGNLESTTLSIGDEVESNVEIGQVSEDNNVVYFEIIQSGIPLDPESFF